MLLPLSLNKNSEKAPFLNLKTARVLAHYLWCFMTYLIRLYSSIHNPSASLAIFPMSKNARIISKYLIHKLKYLQGSIFYLQEDSQYKLNTFAFSVPQGECPCLGCLPRHFAWKEKSRECCCLLKMGDTVSDSTGERKSKLSLNTCYVPHSGAMCFIYIVSI